MRKSQPTHINRTSDQAVIVLNGPNLLNEKNFRICENKDVICFSTGSLIQQLNPVFFFHEPWEAMDLAFKKNLRYTIYENLFIALEIPMIESLIKKSQGIRTKVITNPQPFKSNFIEYPEYMKVNITKWISCDETTFMSGHRDSRRYVEKKMWEEGYLLNYRCSLIRAFTLCLSLGYSSITILGMNPSTPHYWFSANTKRAIKYINEDLDINVYKQIFDNFHYLINTVNNATHDDQALTHISETTEREKKSIGNVLFSFLSTMMGVCPEEIARRDIEIITDDPLIYQIASQYNLLEMIKSDEIMG